MSRILLGSVCGALAWIAFASAARPADVRWLRLGAPAGLDRAEALAIAPGSGRLAVGGERGVALGPPAGPLERVLSRGPVRDLLFTPDGALLAATDVGLYRIDVAGRVRSERLGAGESARAVRDLDALGGRVVAATAAGVYRSEAGVWQRVTGLPSGDVGRIALLADGRGGLGIWAAIDGALWHADDGAAGRRVALPDALGGEPGPVDLARGGAGVLLVLLPRSLVLRTAAGAWQTERLVLPPGAAPRRLAAARERLWLATDAGLLVSTGPAGPWRRAGPPAGHVAVAALAGAGEQLVVATAHGLLRPAARAPGAPAPAAAVATADAARPRGVQAQAPTARPAADPPVFQVQRRALRYLSLEPARMEALWRAAGRRGLYPQLSVRADYGRDRDRGDDYDQTFSSGDTRHLFDRDRRRGEDLGVSLVLSWDLGDAAFNPDRIALSRESRLVAQLRDDVLDEINQLYFERQRVLASLASPPPDTPPDALRRRAAELASGLDAWTGGWFSARAGPHRVRGPASPAQEPLP